ncbi:MAG: hypothetical protein U0931_26790 [Vulcanimicrobiota bacterium]
MRMLCVIFLALTVLAGADEITGTLTRANSNQLEVKVGPKNELMKFELQGKTLPGNLKVGDRVTVDYTPQRVAVAAAGGARQCLQFLVVSSVKPAAK